MEQKYEWFAKVPSMDLKELCSKSKAPAKKRLLVKLTGVLAAAVEIGNADYIELVNS